MAILTPDELKDLLPKAREFKPTALQVHLDKAEREIVKRIGNPDGNNLTARFTPGNLFESFRLPRDLRTFSGISEIQIVSGGSNYAGSGVTHRDLLIPAPPEGGVQATARAEIEYGVVRSVQVTEQGLGYPERVAATLPNDDGDDATFRIVWSASASPNIVSAREIPGDGSDASNLTFGTDFYLYLLYIRPQGVWNRRSAYEFTYHAETMLAEARLAQSQLVALSLVEDGLASIEDGEFVEERRAQTGKDGLTQAEARIFARLTPGGLFFGVG